MTAATKLDPRKARRLHDFLARVAGYDYVAEAIPKTICVEAVGFMEDLARAGDARSRRLERSRPRREAKAGRRAEKVKVRREVRDACEERAKGRCEACRAGWMSTLELDHFWGRAREESVESCWMLCHDCHRSKTDNRPTRIFWLRVFGQHCEGHGYNQQKIKAGAAVMLETAQHPAREAGGRTTP